MTTSSLSSSSLKVLNNLKHGFMKFEGEVSAVIGDAHSDLQCTIEVKDRSLFRLIAKDGVLGAAEGYIQGLWNVDDLVMLIRILVRNRDLLDQMNSKPLVLMSQYLMRIWYRQRKNSHSGSKKNISEHYDLSNDFFKLFLDENMMYSSAVFDSEALESMSLSAESLEIAADRKLDLICRKLDISETDHVIEIGSGWGGFAIYAATHYGCKVTTTTISEEQYQCAKTRIEGLGLSDKITLLKKDYRDLSGEYDKLVSIEMIEAVGHQYLDIYFSACHKLLKKEGLALIQAITIEDARYHKALNTVDYIKRYVFPGSFIPCNTVMIKSAANTGLKLLDFEDIGSSYALTIKHWRTRFFENISVVESLGFDQRFIRMWEFYLCYCEGGFMEEVISDAHLVFKKSM